MKSCALRLTLTLCCLGATFALAQDPDLDDAKKFLAGRPELASLVSKVATKTGAGVYRLETGAADPKVFLVKSGNAWVLALTLDKKKFDLGALVPSSVLGGTSVKTLFFVVGNASGTLSAKGLGGELEQAVAALGKDAAFAPGLNLFSQIDVAGGGTLGQLRTAGMLPGGPLWISGTLGGSVMDSLLIGNAPDLKGTDFTLTLAVASLTPAPFSLIPNPKLTLGDGTFTFTRTAGAFSLSGQQLNSKLLLPDNKTFLIPKTTLTFTKSADAWDVAVEGASQDKQPWKNAFGLNGVELKQVTLRGTISSTKTGATTPPIRGFGLALGAKVSVNKRDYDGEFSIDVEANKLKELTIRLSGDLNLGFIPGGSDFTFKQFSLAVSPASMQAAVAGELQWRDLNGRAAVVLSKQPMLFLHLKELDLASLVVKGKQPAGMPAIPKLNLLLVAGFGANAGDVTNLPGAAQEMIDEVSGATGGKVKVTNGLSVVTRIDAKAIGADQYGQNGPVLLAGSLDVMKGSFRIAASLPSIPPIQGLPQGFGVEAPEVFLALDQKSGAPVASFGLGLRLMMPVDGQVLAFKGQLAASTAGTFSFTGALETNWVNPIGLQGVTILAPVVVSIGVGADASVDLGFQAGLAIAKQTYNPMAMCLNVQAAPVPVPKKLALRFKGSEFGPQAQMDIMEAFVKSAVNGPLKNGIEDKNTRLALSQVGPQVDKISDAADGLGLNVISFTQVDVALTSPGVTCDIPAIEGMGIKLVGTARFMGKPIGSLDSYVNLTQGLKVDSKINDLDFLDLVKLRNARLDILAPMPGAAPQPSAAASAKAEKAKKTLAKRKSELKANAAALKKTKDDDEKADLKDEKEDLENEIADLEKEITRGTGPDYGHFYLKGRAEVLRSNNAELNIELDKAGASFEFSSELADLGSLQMSAETEGQNLAQATDFTVGLTIGDDAHAKFLKNLGNALKASAAARKQASGDLSKGTDAALKAAQDEYERLDAQAGKDFRKAQKDLKKAKKKFKKAERGIKKAKKKCEEDLGIAKDLCGTLDAAKETLKATRGTMNVAKDALKAIKKSSDYARLQTAKGTIASIKAGKKAADAGLAGWGAVDNVGQMVLDGASNEFLNVEEIELKGSLKKLTGSLAVTVNVGEEEVEETYEVNLRTGEGLDLVAFAGRVADEITEQANDPNSPVGKALRKGKK